MRKRVLVVEDDKQVASQYDAVLKEEGAIVTIINNYEEAAELITKNNYDMALFDWNIQTSSKDKTGKISEQLVQLIKEKNPSTFVNVISQELDAFEIDVEKTDYYEKKQSFLKELPDRLHHILYDNYPEDNLPLDKGPAKMKVYQELEKYYVKIFPYTLMQPNIAEWQKQRGSIVETIRTLTGAMKIYMRRHPKDIPLVKKCIQHVENYQEQILTSERFDKEATNNLNKEVRELFFEKL